MDASWPADSHVAGDVGDSPASTVAEAAIDDGGEHVDAVATGGYKAPSDAEVEEIGARDAGKQERRSWTDSHDVKLINAARAANAHVAPRGKISERFENAATIFNSQPQAPFTVTGKVMQDRFNTLRKQYTTQDNADAKKTGHEKEDGDTELQVLLQDVMPKSVEIKEREKVERNEASEKDEKLVADGAAIRQMAMERRRRHAKSLEGGSSDDAEDAPAISRSTPTKNSARRGRRRMRSEMDDEDEDIVEIIQQSEKRREDLANKQIALEERRMVDERQFRRDEAVRRKRQDAAQHEERQALLRVLEAMTRKLG